ncbi:hypothetical protein [Streptomyces indiaensis]|uniref:hypothetical protein n=1 Tax=Streptomyces indiaensis TaxID=284033 RepID=UPI001F481201|nr:hypothetical protein [Streptomyces indiaensis]MCF1649231.1 hypothetical protein [Streptomyces indiaensis]
MAPGTSWEPEELDEIAPGRSRSVDITDFVDLEEIEPRPSARGRPRPPAPARHPVPASGYVTLWGG